MILALTSDTYTKPQMYDVASTILQQKLSQVTGVGQVYVGGGSPPAVRVDVNPTVLNHFGLGLEDVRTALGRRQCQSAQGADCRRARMPGRSRTTDQLLKADEYEPLIVAYRNGAPVRLGDVATVTDSVEDIRATGIVERQAVDHADHLPPAGRQHHRHGRPRSRAAAAIAGARFPAGIELRRRHGPHDDDSRVGRTTCSSRCCFRSAWSILVVFLVSARLCGPRSFPASPCRFR